MWVQLKSTWWMTSLSHWDGTYTGRGSVCIHPWSIRALFTQEKSAVFQLCVVDSHKWPSCYTWTLLDMQLSAKFLCVVIMDSTFRKRCLLMVSNCCRYTVSYSKAIWMICVRVLAICKCGSRKADWLPDRLLWGLRRCFLSINISERCLCHSKILNSSLESNNTQDLGCLCPKQTSTHFTLFILIVAANINAKLN